MSRSSPVVVPPWAALVVAAGFILLCAPLLVCWRRRRKTRFKESQDHAVAYVQSDMSGSGAPQQQYRAYPDSVGVEHRPLEFPYPSAGANRQ